MFDAAEADAFEKANVDPINVGIDVPETSQFCNDESTKAHAAAVAFVDKVSEQVTFNNWLNDKVAECCNGLEADYEGIFAIA